jgi:hypothetical protein
MRDVNASELLLVDQDERAGMRGHTLADVLIARSHPSQSGPVIAFPVHPVPIPVPIPVPVPDPVPAGPPLALVPAAVVAGQIYPAADGGAPFALPGYALEVVDGRYTTRLKWRAPEDAPGPIAVLTLGLSVVLASAPDGGPVREIVQQPTARLVHTVRVGDQADQAARLVVDLGAVQRVSASSAAIRYEIHEKAEFDALWQALTDPAAAAVLELSGPVTVARRTWRQIPRLPIFVSINQEMLAQAAQLTHVTPVPPPGAGPVPRPFPRFPTPGGGLGFPRPGLPRRQENVAGPAPVTLALDAPTVQRMRMAPPGAAFALRPRVGDDFVPVDKQTFAASDLTWQGKKAVPVRVVTDFLGAPATVVTTVAADQSVAPVLFPLATNAYVFDVPGDLRPTTTRLLLRHEFDPGGTRPRLVYYADTAFPNRYYYEPLQFRVPRAGAAPNLPLVAIAFSDLVVHEDNGSADLTYTARLRYVATPDLDPVVLGALRRELAGGPGGPAVDLTALLPDEATVRLLLPDDTAGGALVESSRTLTRNAFDDGFSDEIELSQTELAALVALLQTDGVRGTIAAELIGAGHTEIPLLISLRDAPAVALGRAYRGPVGDGLVRVAVFNPLESPIEILELYRSPAGNGAFAFPQSDPGVVIAAGGSANLDYRLDPPGADVDDVEPLLRVRVHTDLHVLLPKLMVNAGFAAETFDLTVTCDAGFFGPTPPGAPGPLTALLVEFESDAEAVLAAAQPSRELKIRIPILPWLLKESGAEQYRYRVTNLHGTGDDAHPGAVGEWIAGVGSGSLPVTPVGA